MASSTHIDSSFVGNYVRMEADGVPVYVYPDGPDWFVPSDPADRLLRTTLAGKEDNGKPGIAPEAGQDIERFLARIVPHVDGSYPGRATYHSLSALKECWFHITNKCDMACTHCMFASGGKGNNEELEPGRLRRAIAEARGLGCRMFFFTGGEPFVYPGFTGIYNEIFAEDGTHVVVLTNARGLERHASWLDAVPKGRLHLQVSIDGDRECHDEVRGDGAYEQLMGSLALLRGKKIPVTLSMSVTAQNVVHMRSVVECASRYGVGAVHYMWLFVRGRATQRAFVDTGTLTRELFAAYDLARERGVSIDNIEMLRSQLFTIPRTRFDLSNSGWESIAVGPDGGVYPSPALVGFPELHAGDVDQGLEKVWRSSEVLDRVRETSLVHSGSVAGHPLRFILGGGDIDHSYHAGKSFVGHDPYVPLYTDIALRLIVEHAANHPANGRVGIRCRMGEYLVECGPESRPVMFTHSNCVLSVSGHDSHSLVKSFYSRAAESTNEEILNPVSYGEENLLHVPEPMRVRSYGCGSPVLDCDLQPGQRIADLGSGTGIECFIAAKAVGTRGRAFGIDMSDSMLRRAREALPHVEQALGYGNVEFRKGLLEKLPLESDSLDFVTSNCVINLTSDKRGVFEEIYRVLKPGGMLCISDIVTISEIPIDMKYNEKLRGECLGGAMLQQELFAMIEELGFAGTYLVRRYEYRRVQGYPFYSITYRAVKPSEYDRHTVVYRGPHDSIVVDGGERLVRGVATRTAVDSALLDTDSFFVLDETGAVTNVAQEAACGVFVNTAQAKQEQSDEPRHATGCMVCGEQLAYLRINEFRECYYCGQRTQANALCSKGHFVCDQCHSRDARKVIRSLCEASGETDPVALYNRIRSHPSIPVHGPEYHSLVPAVLVAVWRNMGNAVLEGAIATAVDRGASVAGGACAFLGCCGAAQGIGIALSIILGGTPFQGGIRKSVQRATMDILEHIAELDAPRCCHRESLIALTRFVQISYRYLPQALHTAGTGPCTQFSRNEHCIGEQCPWRRAGYGVG